MGESTCSEIEHGEPCGAPVLARGLCNRHYKRWRRHGDTKIRRSLPFPENLLRRLIFMQPDRFPSGCILHDSLASTSGYHYVGRDGRPVGAHIAAWELLHGPIPVGLEIDHLCFRKACVNPAHLQPVTHQENSRRRGYGQRVGRRTPKCGPAQLPV
jgi:hypothetical protein